MAQCLAERRVVGWCTGLRDSAASLQSDSIDKKSISSLFLHVTTAQDMQCDIHAAHSVLAVILGSVNCPAHVCAFDKCKIVVH